MNEGVLIERVRAGDTAAFGQLVEAYQRPVYNLCYRLLGNLSEAEDAAQETFLRAYRQLDRYDATRPFKTWLFSIANHHCVDLLRRRRLTWLDIDDEPLSGHPALREPAPGPEAIALQREREDRIRSLLASLPPKDRSVIVMHYWHNLSYQEIAEVTGSTLSAVKSRLHRARVVLAGLLNSTEKQRIATPVLLRTAVVGFSG